MRLRLFDPRGEARALDSLAPIVEALQQRREFMAGLPIRTLLALMGDFSQRILESPGTRAIEGLAFLSSWLRRSNLEGMLRLNLNGSLDCLDGFIPAGSGKLAARPLGLVCMWMAGNVPTLPIFSLVPALLTKNVCLIKLAKSDSSGTEALLSAFAEAEAVGLRGADVLEGVAVVSFDHRDSELNRTMSLAADAKLIWGGESAVRGIKALEDQEHCVELVFGPKYSIGVIDRRRLTHAQGLEGIVAAFVRDIAAFDQRACSSPQTIFVERNDDLSLRQVGELFAAQFARLRSKPDLDAYTALRILNTRAAWALHERRDVIASGPEADWTICMDREVSLKEAVQSRTVFLTEVDSLRQVIPLLSPKVQTVGVAFDSNEDAEAFAEAATLRGVARCVRPGLMNLYESPWDGKLVASQLVRWVTLKA